MTSARTNNSRWYKDVARALDGWVRPALCAAVRQAHHWGFQGFSGWFLTFNLRERLTEWAMRCGAMPAGTIHVGDTPRSFWGRVDEARQIQQNLQTPGDNPVCIAGPGGVGKTTLATLVAENLTGGNAAAFAGGVCRVDMRGSSEAPLPAEEAMQQVIRWFRPDAAPPSDRKILKQHYNNFLQRENVLIVVDDAPPDAKEVDPLRPPAGNNALLITTRRSPDLG